MKTINSLNYVAVTVICFFMGIASVWGQDEDLLKQLEEEESEPVEEKVGSTFKGTRLINGHSVELRQAGVLDFMISHRFGRVNSGSYQFFGLDDAQIRLGLEYALSNRLTLGIGRNSFQKVYDGLVKYKLLWQQTGEKEIPVSVVWMSNMAVNTFKRPDLPMNFKRRLAYTHQLLVARKFNDHFSFQLSPTYVHRNLVSSNSLEQNELFAMGLGGRYKLTPSTSLNMEYYYRLNAPDTDLYRNVVAIGVDIETGGHVFQLHLTNAQAMTETGFIPATSGNFWDGDIHFGFNISRTFQIKNGRGPKW